MGNNNTTMLINTTDDVMEIREFRGIITHGNNPVNPITVKARQHTYIDVTKYGGDDCHGGQLSKLTIFCYGSYLKSSTEGEVAVAVLDGQQFINSKTVAIYTVAEIRNVVHYKVTFEPRDASASPTHYKVYRDLVLEHDNGWSVQHCENGIVKLTREEGMTMTLDPLKLFARDIVPDPAVTSLLNVVLKFWPRTFADLNCKDDLRTTIDIVKDLMCQAKFYCVDKSRFEVDKVVQKVAGLHKSCAAMVEWYHPLFPGMEDQFPLVAMTDQDKLKRFADTIIPLLQQPNSLDVVGGFP